jgi:hypothetical protein
VDYIDDKSSSLFKARSELVTSHSKEILDLLETMCYNDNLNIFFLKTSVYPEYSIHNATNDKLARLYFKRGDDYFMEWASGLEAYRFWRDIKDENGVDNPDLPGAIFHGGRDFELSEAGFRKAMWNGMRKYFGGIAEDVMGLCLNGRDYQRRQLKAGVPARVAEPTP